MTYKEVDMLRAGGNIIKVSAGNAISVVGAGVGKGLSSIERIDKGIEVIIADIVGSQANKLVSGLGENVVNTINGGRSYSVSTVIRT